MSHEPRDCKPVTLADLIAPAPPAVPTDPALIERWTRPQAGTAPRERREVIVEFRYQAGFRYPVEPKEGS